MVCLAEETRNQVCERKNVTYPLGVVSDNMVNAKFFSSPSV